MFFNKYKLKNYTANIATWQLKKVNTSVFTMSYDTKYYWLDGNFQPINKAQTSNFRISYNNNLESGISRFPNCSFANTQEMPSISSPEQMPPFNCQSNVSYVN